MIKSELNNLLRDYVRNHLSPTETERNLVSKIYNSLKTGLDNNVIMIGSYARFTAIRPLHDLDILYIAGSFEPENPNPRNVLNDLKSTIETSFENPTSYKYEISLQTHSVTILFLDGTNEIFSVDIVPAYTSGEKNEYGDDIYWVPEILRYNHNKRNIKYQEFNDTRSELEWWLKSDPCGYIKATSEINEVNDDFRKTAKIIKRWKHNCKEKFEGFKLKSFHIEQELYKIFKENIEIEISDAIFKFFCGIPEFISRPQILDRADSSKFIDEYLENLTDDEKHLIIKARDAFLIKLESMSQNIGINNLLEAESRERASSTEAYLFDEEIPTYIDPDIKFSIQAKAFQADTGSFRGFILDTIGEILVGRKIEFRIRNDESNANLYKWKVKNDDRSEEPRGEITDYQTKYDPENSKYPGNHYVECYAIKDGVCIARAKQDIFLR